MIFANRSMRRRIMVLTTVLWAWVCNAQTIERKLIEEAELDSAELVTLTGLDSLACCLDLTSASVDTTVMLTDSLAMSLLFVGDNVGVCAVRYLLVWRKEGLGSRSLSELYTECDGGAGEEEFMFNMSRILEDHSIVVVELSSREYEVDGVVHAAPLRIVSWRLVQVMNDGSVSDTGDVDPREWSGPVYSVTEIMEWKY